MQTIKKASREYDVELPLEDVNAFVRCPGSQQLRAGTAQARVEESTLRDQNDIFRGVPEPKELLQMRVLAGIRASGSVLQQLDVRDEDGEVVCYVFW